MDKTGESRGGLTYDPSYVLPDDENIRRIGWIAGYQDGSWMQLRDAWYELSLVDCADLPAGVQTALAVLRRERAEAFGQIDAVFRGDYRGPADKLLSERAADAGTVSEYFAVQYAPPLEESPDTQVGEWYSLGAFGSA